MELIRTIRQKQLAARQATIQRQAENIITVSDFENELFIAFDGVPLVPIDKSWTAVQIVERLIVLRQNYVNARLKDYGLPRYSEATNIAIL